MFTGLVQATARVERLDPTKAGVRLAVDVRGWDHRPTPGDSICVNGVCLTLAAPPSPTPAGSLFVFDVVPETLSRTTLGDLAPGSRVNLEHSATPTTLLGGHILQGHVDATASVERIDTAHEHRIVLRPSTGAMEYITPKGSVAVEGVSLTVAHADPGAGTFDIALIPVTLENTTLGALKPGQRVNLETDVLARTLVHWARHYAAPRN